MVSAALLATISGVLGYALAQQAAPPPAALAYTPLSSPCPANLTLVRSAGGKNPTLSPQESAYVAERRRKVLPGAFKTYLSVVERSADQQNIPLPHYLTTILGGQGHLPTMSISMSGGGMRAAIFHAAMLNAFDARNATSADAGLAGLLQASTYTHALSAGAWTMLSMLQANFPTIQDLVFGTDSGPGGEPTGGWNSNFGIATISSNTTVEDDFVEVLLTEIAGKFQAGFPVTIGDVWSRALARHFTNGTTPSNFFATNVTHGAGLRMSSIIDLPEFTNHALPFPTVTTDTISTFQNNSDLIPMGISPLSNPIYEINLFEFGSFDDVLHSFIPISLLGSQNGTCVTNFDQISFVQAVSSDLFSSDNTSTVSLNDSLLGSVVAVLNENFEQPGIRLDSAAIPNPFMGIEPEKFIDHNQTILVFADGDSDGENVPFQPALVKERSVDVIIAIDVSSDIADNFANGSALVVAQERVAQFSHQYSFPPVPSSTEVFVAQNLTTRPTFFGCNTSPDVPLLVYFANGGPPLGQTPVTNFSTLVEAVPQQQVQSIMDQVFDIATQGIPINGVEKDPKFPLCLACAVADRTRARMGKKREGVCETCMTEYCYN
ncbi:uncharacterized protein PHACADRAFT_206193 [Phanerochaete carnosa HHB-10118-sp]|uniref:Lysophospholipase n=1 Tax=Phanerochaete carnosa (strain HHB-10118-sp) TaxID=650164 RepID=K5WLC3_PHACS|nr:uncharacterized protein PHACADRAFT_206193 [Phanerochaete carnosa HHB-10118-sp]EKM59979.1 hypothetical protein PHACADRAFT_206193 [Phanerochaete carnosa HHB-10118-sp]